MFSKVIYLCISNSCGQQDPEPGLELKSSDSRSSALRTEVRGCSPDLDILGILFFFSIHYIIICGFLNKSSNCYYLLRRHLAPYDFSLPLGQSPLTFFHFWEHLVHQNPWPTNLHDQSLSLTVKVRIKKITTLIQKFNFTDFQRSSRYQGNFFALKTKYWTYSISSRPTWNQTKSCNEIL